MSVVDPTRFQIRTADGATHLVGLAGIRLPAGELAWDQETLQDFRVIMDDELLYQVGYLLEKYYERWLFQSISVVYYFYLTNGSTRTCIVVNPDLIELGLHKGRPSTGEAFSLR
jgi:hypothetical protein